MRNNSDIKELAEGIKGLFRERCGDFRAEDFVAVADLLGFDARLKQSVEKQIGASHDQKQQAGEGFWAVAPGAGDISEGMVWVSSPQITPMKREQKGFTGQAQIDAEKRKKNP